jgi:hypothetical protein
MKKYLLIFLFGCLAIVANAQQPIASAHVDTNTVLIGNPVTILLRLSQPASLSIDWPDVDSIGQFEVLSKGKIDTLNTDEKGTLLRAQTLTVTAYDSGHLTIPSFSFNYKEKGTEVQKTVTTEPLAINVLLVQVDTTKEIQDIRPVVDVPYDWSYILLVILGWLLLILIVGGIILWFQRKKKQDDAVVAPELLRPAHEIALEELAALDEGKFWQQGNIKYYYSSLTEIVRHYIELRWKVNAMELTSDEILANGFVQMLDAEQKEKLSYLVRLADLVKFAKSQPLAYESEQSMGVAVQFVKVTALVEQTSTAAAEIKQEDKK